MRARQQESACSEGSGLGQCDVRLGRRLTRGEIWTSASRADYAGKPRPVVIIQHRHFATLDSVTICGFTSDPTELPLFRIAIEPSATNRLEFTSHIMVDKVMTVPKTRLGYRIGQLDNRAILQLNQALRVFLGLTE